MVIAHRYATIVAAMQADPACLFSYPGQTHRIVAYLAWCAPGTHSGQAIARAAHVSPVTVGKLLRNLMAKKVVVKLTRAEYKLHPLYVWSGTPSEGATV